VSAKGCISRDPDSAKSCNSQESSKLHLWYEGVGNGGLGQFPHDSGIESVPLRTHLGRCPEGDIIEPST
jgi:hypothetical protein